MISLWLLLSATVSCAGSDYHFWSACPAEVKAEEQRSDDKQQRFVVEDSSRALQLTQSFWTGDRLVVRVFRAPIDKLSANDYFVKGDLDLVVSTEPGEDREFRAARLRLATEGQEGPTILTLKLITARGDMIDLLEEAPEGSDGDADKPEKPRKLRCRTQEPGPDDEQGG